jgi:hypothetical protein
VQKPCVPASLRVDIDERQTWISEWGRIEIQTKSSVCVYPHMHAKYICICNFKICIHVCEHDVQELIMHTKSCTCMSIVSRSLSPASLANWASESTLWQRQCSLKT